MRRALLALMLVLLALRTEAGNLAVSQGFAADKLYDFHDIDSVNTFNGNLILQLPIGPSYPINGGMSYGLGLSYNSKVWTYVDAGGVPRAVPDPRSNAGMGWLLSMGHLLTTTDSFGDEERNSYVSADGAVHKFFTTLHDGDAATTLTAGVSSVGYSRDGSYLRQLIRTDGTIDVEFPNGTVQNFNATTGKLNTIRDRYNNGVNLTYFTAANIGLTQCPSTDTYAWQITDTKPSRTNWVCFKTWSYPDSVSDGQVERIILAAPSTSSGTARTATYLFGYTPITVARGCHSQYPNDSTTVSVPMLTMVTLPDGTRYAFTYNATATSAHCEQGTMASASLPTGGTISYTYQYYRIPAMSCSPTGSRPTENITGVGTRKVSRPGLPDATWTYASTTNTPAFMVWCTRGELMVQVAAPAEQLTVAETDPLGNVIEHYYSVWPGDGTSPNGPMPEEYGLPFTRLISKSSTTNLPAGWPATGGTPLYLSERIYTPAGYAASPKAPEREVYVRYEQDPITAGCSEQSYCERTNPRRRIEQTVFTKDGARVIETNRDNFDGLGHYRSELHTYDAANFTAGISTTYAGFNTRDAEVNPTTGIASGTYTTSGTFTVPTAATQWLINQAPTTKVTEGTATLVSQTCWDAVRGVVKLQRQRLSSASPDVKDAVVAYTRDTAGNVTAETYYGGDNKANAPAAGTALCNAVTPATSSGYDYKINHTYSDGVRNTSTYAGSSFKFLDLTIDAKSGAAMKSADTGGLLTLYGYDTAFRLTSVDPPGPSATTYTYASASVAGGVLTPAQVTVSTAATTQGAQFVYQYDALGRLWRSKQLLPDGTYGVRETLYDVAGNVSFTSEQERLVIPTGGNEFSFVPSHKTQFTSYDPFGRYSSVQRPDLSTTTYVYTGARQMARTVSVQTTTGAANATTTETYDALGRLASVLEGGVTTSYAYDTAGRLKQVSMPGSATQIRTFTYDGRGFLTGETHPETGIAGNGTITYSHHRCARSPSSEGHRDVRRVRSHDHVRRVRTRDADLSDVQRSGTEVVRLR